MSNFKKDKEYFINGIRCICTKIKKDTKGNIINISFIDLEANKELIFKLEDIHTIKNPIENVEFFSMYLNWNNYYRKGLHQDLEFAKEIFFNIINSLNDRSFVISGTGSFVNYDYKKLYTLLNSYDLKLITISDQNITSPLNEGLDYG